MPFVDAHLHFWDASVLSYPWLQAPDCADLPTAFTHQDLVEAGGMPASRLVHVQAEADHDLDALAEVAWVDSQAPANSVVHVTYADLRRPDISQELTRLSDREGVRGIRQEAWFDPLSTRADIPTTDFLNDTRWLAGLEKLAGTGLSFDLLVRGHQLERAADVFSGHPDLVVVLNHVGLPGSGPDEYESWFRGMRRLANEVPNCYVKLSGWSMFSPGWSEAQALPYVNEVLNLFSAKRCMLASNFPVERALSNYRSYWERVDEMTRHLSLAERSALLAGSATTCYRLGIS